MKTTAMSYSNAVSPSMRSGLLPLFGGLVLVILLAVFFGLLASTANPIVISLGAGLLAGALLLAKPEWNVWLILVPGLMIAGLIPIWADALSSKAVWGISLLGFVLLFAALLKAFFNPSMVRNTPAFLWLALLFLVYTVLNGLANGLSFYEFLSGFKRHFQVIGLLFALSWLGFDEGLVRRWRKLFIVVALLQLPWALYELLRLVPIREGYQYAYRGLVPIDVVAGTFGANMYSGGANAEMATFLIIILAFMLSRQKEKLISLGRVLWLLPFAVIPLFMGETKVVVLLLPLMFMTLFRGELLARPHIALVGIVFGALLTVAAGYAYLNITKKSLDEEVSDILRYNVYEKGQGNYVLNRTQVLTFWWKRHGSDDPTSIVFGHGLGSTKEETGGHVAQRYPGYGIGLTATSTLLWEEGVFGTALFVSMIYFAWRVAGKLKSQTKLAWVRADASAIQAALVIFSFYLFYRNTMLEVMPFQIVFYALLGYLAWMHRQHTRAVEGG